jgi:transcriptional regulator of acetoin/glycerol metabolism
MEYNWPGNVRELQNAIQHACSFSQNNLISSSSLPIYISSYSKNFADSSESLESVKREYIIKVLEGHSWNYIIAAKILGLDRSTMYRKIKEYDLKSQ